MAVEFDPTESVDLRPRVQSTKHHAWGSRVFLIIMSLLFLIPLYWLVITAFKTPADLAQASPSWIPRTWAWSNFKDAFQAFPFGRFFINSVIITVLTVVGTVVSNLIVAYGFACLEWRGRDKLFLVVIATMFLPGAITLIPVFDLWGWLHAINTWIPLIVPSFFASAFFVFLLRQFMMQIPKDLLDAARIEGASEMRVLWQVVAPMSKPAVATICIFSALAAWNDFMGPLIYIQDQKLQTLAIGLQYLRQTQPDKITTNLLMAASLMVIIPVVILFFVFQRYFIRGITVGSIR
jgi:multiple sugar transport system permease protein